MLQQCSPILHHVNVDNCCHPSQALHTTIAIFVLLFQSLQGRRLFFCCQQFQLLYCHKCYSLRYSSVIKQYQFNAGTTNNNLSTFHCATGVYSQLPQLDNAPWYFCQKKIKWYRLSTRSKEIFTNLVICFILKTK